MNSKVDGYIAANERWQQEMEALRVILLDCLLIEEWKWRVPCYTFQGANIALINPLKEYCAVGFFKGALLSDSNKVLYQQTENSESVRLIKFTSVQQIMAMEDILKSYIFEAIEIERIGLKVVYKKSTDLEMPEELQQKFVENVAFKAAFEALTPGRQKGYMLHFTAPKQSKTRVSRIEDCTTRILGGKGLNDCTCGFSKRMPACDGSHKYL